MALNTQKFIFKNSNYVNSCDLGGLLMSRRTPLTRSPLKEALQYFRRKGSCFEVSRCLMCVSLGTSVIGSRAEITG